MKTTVGFFLFMMCCPTYLWAQDQESLILKHLDAIGAGKRKEVRSFLVEATRSSEGLEISEKRLVKLPNSLRIDLVYHGRDAEQSKKKYFVLLNSSGAWRYLPGFRRDTTEAMQASERAYYSRLPEWDDPFYETAEQATKISYLNRERIEEKEYYKFSIGYKDGSNEYIYLDPDSYLLYKRVSLMADGEQEYTYSDYRTIDNGLVLPFRIVSLSDTLQVKTFTINPSISKSSFELPQKAAGK